jgi:hypothetical protein
VDHQIEDLLLNGVSQIDVLRQCFSYSHAFRVGDGEGSLSFAAKERGVLREAELLVKVKVEHCGELFNVSGFVRCVDSRVGAGLVSEAGATEVVDNLDCRAAVDALLTELANVLDRKRLAIEIVAHVHVILRDFILVVLELLTGHIYDEWQSVGIENDARLSLQDRLALLSGSLLGCKFSDDFGPKIFLPRVKVVLRGEGFGVTHSHFMDAVTAKLLECLVENLTHLVVLLVRGVTETKDSEVHSLERLLALLLLDFLHPLNK